MIAATWRLIQCLYVIWPLNQTSNNLNSAEVFKMKILTKCETDVEVRGRVFSNFP